MGTWSGSTFGGGAGGGGNGVPLSSIIMRAYRIAGIFTQAATTPGPDKYSEAIPELNAMLGNWNCDGHKIFTTNISTPFPLEGGKKIYTIGPGGDFDTDRPIYISGANVLFPTNPIVRRPLSIISDAQWRSIAVQDISGAPPYTLYYDGGLDPTTGLAQIYIRFQPPGGGFAGATWDSITGTWDSVPGTFDTAGGSGSLVSGYSLELYTWQALQTSFSNPSDIAVFPPGYEMALVYNLAKSLAALNPHLQNMHPDSHAMAANSLHALISLNIESPQISTEPGLSREIGAGYGWLDRSGTLA